MPATPTARYQERQDEILAVAGRVFARDGYHQASMRDIAREAVISLAGLYYYAESKEELLFAISVRAFDTVIQGARGAIAAGTSAEDRLANIVRNHLDYFVSHLDEMKVLSHEADSLTGTYRSEIQARKRRYVTLVEEVVATLREDGGIDRRLATLSLFGMMNWIYTWYQASDGNVGPIADTMTRIFLQGFAEPHASNQRTDGRKEAEKDEWQDCEL